MRHARRRILRAATAIAAGVLSMSANAHSMIQVEADLAARERYVQLANREAPGFNLQDADGRSVSLDDFRGKAVVLNFLYARCREACPPHSARIEQIQALVAEVSGLAQQIQFVTVATDTEDATETAAEIRDDRALHEPFAANWVFIHGGPGRERAGIGLAKAYGLEFVSTDDAEQMTDVVTHVIDPSGRLRARFHGLKFDPLNLMIYAAALAHGDHRPTDQPVASEPPGQIDGWQRSMSIGTIFAVLTVLGYGIWIRWRPERIESDMDCPSAGHDGDTAA